MFHTRTNIFTRERRLKHRLLILTKYALHYDNANDAPDFELDELMTEIFNILEELCEIERRK